MGKNGVVGIAISGALLGQLQAQRLFVRGFVGQHDGIFFQTALKDFYITAMQLCQMDTGEVCARTHFPRGVEAPDGTH